MALATRCPHCETVFKLDPHLLAPHDGRVRCGHCQEVFDAAHHQFELPDDGAAPGETQHASLVDDELAVGPKLTVSRDTPAVDAGLLPPSPVEPIEPAPPADARDRDGPHRSRPTDLPLPPKYTAPRPFTPNGEPARRGEPLARISADAPGDASATAPRDDTPPAQASRVKQFIRVGTPQADDANKSAPHFRLDTPPPPRPPDRPIERTPERTPERPAPPPDATRFAAPIDDRAEPFIGPVSDSAHASDTPPLQSTPDEPWRDEAEPAFGATAPGIARAASANEAFPSMREPAKTSEPPEPLAPSGAARPARRGWRAAGIVVAILLGLLLIAQFAWWQRESLMVSMPATRPLFVAVCDQLDCTIPPPRYIDGLQIESSGLRQVDGPHKLELKLSLRNRSDVALAYPALEVTLLDDKNNVAIRRVLWPQDYARPGTIFAIGLPAQSAQPVIVRLDTGDAIAANYRVQVFYP